MSDPAPIVDMRGITIEFPGVRALDDVDFRLLPGEVHALMGENGAGKSTLIKALTGVNTLAKGEILLDGRPQRFAGTADAQRAGIAVVYQEVNLCPNLTIGENVMLGRERRGRFGIDWAATNAAAVDHLATLGLGHLDPQRPLSSVSLALQQLVAISRAMVGESRVLILDEPTSSLDASEVEQLFGVMRALRDDGVAMLFVSHFLDQVYEISDRITVLRNGRLQGEHRTEQLDRGSLIAAMIGKELDTLRSIDRERDEHREERHDRVVLDARGVARAGAVAPTDLTLHRGEVVGLAGLLGSGRTELARLLCGADRADEGTVEVDGDPLALASPAEALAHGIAYSSENRRDEGIVGDLTVRENIVLAVQARRGWSRPMSRQDQDALVARYVAALDIRPADPETPIRNLSGGNQQKVLLARWLATEPAILVLDEPTRGIDVGAKAEIQALVADLAGDGVAVVFISSELDEVVRISDRVVVLRDHRVIGEIEVTADTTADTAVAMIAAEGAA